MGRLIVNDTEIASWQALVREVETAHGPMLEENLEHYLVSLLKRYTNEVDLADSVLALDYLENLGAADNLRDVGDRCLLFAGLFPERAIKRNVSVPYYIDLGQHAYSVLSSLHRRRALLSKLFASLDQHFVELATLLHEIRISQQVRYLS